MTDSNAIPIILVHTIAKFYYSSPSYCREMQGDAKLHHPPGIGCSETPRNGIFRNTTISPQNRVKTTSTDSSVQCFYSTSRNLKDPRPEIISKLEIIKTAHNSFKGAFIYPLLSMRTWRVSNICIKE